MTPTTLIAGLLGIASGFILTGYAARPADLIATSLVVDAALAPLTAIIAIRRGRSARRWTLLGLAFGVWALVWIMLCRTQRPPSNRPGLPPTSDAA